MNSIWSTSYGTPEFQPLKEHLKTDILIIGGGLTGLLCAYFLQQAGADYILVEGNKICNGITKNSTAKITAQHGLIYHRLLKEQGAKTAAGYLKANTRAVTQYKKLCQTLECDFEEKDAYVYSLEGTKKLQQELLALNQLGFQAEMVKETNLPFAVDGAIKFSNQGQFHPVKFAAHISKGLRIFENTYVKQLTPHSAVTTGGTIYANKIIVATHFPFINKHGSYFMKMYQERSYAIALENAANVKGMYIDQAPKGMSFRNYNNLLIIAGGDHRTGKQGGNWQELRKFAKQYYPNAIEKYSWATQDCMSLDGMPYIGKYSKGSNNLYVATGYNKWGITGSMVAAQILVDMMQGKDNEFAPVFSPSRSMLKKQLAVNALEATANLLNFSKKRCPHLGCALKWNKAEHTWDCPCHGSRFEEDGKLIDNPATGDLPKQS